MKVSLPNDAWAVLRPKSEISERSTRKIARAAALSQLVAKKLEDAGYVDDDPTTYTPFYALSDDETEDLNGVQVILIMEFVTSWSFEQDVTQDTILDLPKAVYDALGEACFKEYTNEVDDLDPKATTGV